MKPTIRQLEAFLAVASLGNFGSAATAIHASPSATSALIKELENLLSAKLFDRTTRSVKLTQAGEAMRDSAARALIEVERVTQQVEAIQSRKMGTVCIAAPPLLAAKLLVPVTQQLRQEFPGLKVRILDVAASEIHALLRTGQADLGVGTPSPSEQLVRVHKLMEGPPILLLPKKHHLAIKRVIPISKLVNEPLVVQLPGSPLRDQLDSFFSSHGLQTQIVAEAAQLGTLISMVESGFGVSVMPCYAPILEHFRGAVARPISGPGLTSILAMIYEADQPLSPAAKTFLDVTQRFISARSLTHHAKA